MRDRQPRRRRCLSNADELQEPGRYRNRHCAGRSRNRLPAEPPVALGKDQAAYVRCTDGPILAKK